MAPGGGEGGGAVPEFRGGRLEKSQEPTMIAAATRIATTRSTMYLEGPEPPPVDPNVTVTTGLVAETRTEPDDGLDGSPMAGGTT